MAPNKEKENIIWKNFFFCKILLAKISFCEISLTFWWTFLFWQKEETWYLQRQGPRIKTPTRKDSHLRSGQGVPKAGPLVETEGRNRMGIKWCKLTKLGKKIASVVGGRPCHDLFYPGWLQSCPVLFPYELWSPPWLAESLGTGNVGTSSKIRSINICYDLTRRTLQFLRNNRALYGGITHHNTSF